MAKELTSEETAVVAKYSNRHDAETAKSFLQDQGISSFVTADDVHPPLQLTEGVRLRVMTSEVRAAKAALEDADMLPDQGVNADDTSVGGTTGLTAWAFVAVLVLIIAAVVVGFLF